MYTKTWITSNPSSNHANAEKVRSVRRAAAAVEFAVMLPLLMIIVLGAVDFGRFAFSYIAVTNGARAGAAYAIMNPYSATTQPVWQAALTQAVQDEMSQFDPSLIQVVATRTLDNNALWRVRVEVAYPFETLVDWPDSYPQTMDLRRSVEIRGIR